MCRSTSDGGQRCAAHARARLDAHATALAHSQATGSDTVRAYRAWQDAAADYASTPTGRAEFETTLEQARLSNDLHAEAVTRSILRRGEDIRRANQATAQAIQDARDSPHSQQPTSNTPQQRARPRRPSTSDRVRTRLRDHGETIPDDFEIRSLRTGSSGRATGTWSWMAYSPTQGALNFGSHYPATDLLRCRNWLVLKPGAERSRFNPSDDRSIYPCQACQASDRIGCPGRQ